MGKSRSSRLRSIRLIPLTALIVVLVTIAGFSASAGSGAATPGAKPLSAAAWRAVVGKAKAEGSVTVYTTGAPANYAELGKRFKEKYGISVTVNRKVDNDLLVQINAEESTGKAVADIWVPTAKGIVLGALKNGWVVDAVGTEPVQQALRSVEADDRQGLDHGLRDPRHGLEHELCLNCRRHP